MSEKKKIVCIERVASVENIAKIKFMKNVPESRLSAYLLAALDKCFKHKFFKIILDLEKITEITNSFVATLIEVTAKVRRRDGDIKIINISEHVREIFDAFNAYTFLSVNVDEK